MRNFITNRVEYLVSTFLNDGLNVEEKNELKKLLKNKEIQNYFKECYLIWHAPSYINDESFSDQAFKKIMYQLEEQSTKTTLLLKTKQLRFFTLTAVAASILIFILGMGTYHLLLSKKGHSKLSISSKNKITVPLGSKSQIELPDGTLVMLNAGSQLVYETNYGENIREVWLEGEGYFNVAENKNSTFVVNAYNVLIKALGTEFNVKAYADEEFVQTTLVKGSVSIDPMLNTREKVENIILRPNQMVTILRNTNTVTDINENKTTTNATELIKLNSIDKKALNKDTQISMETVKTILYTSWKDQRWVIEEESMEELAQKLQRRYDVTISIKDETLKKYKFSGILEDETLEQMLEIMKTIAPIEYIINKKQVSLKTNQRQRKSFEDSMS